MDTYLITLFLALLAFAIGLGEGILWQRAMDERHIRNLEGQRNDAHEEMVQQEWCCERVSELEARVRKLQQFIDRNWYGEIGAQRAPRQAIELDEDDEDDLGDDPPQSVVYVYRRTPTADEVAYGLQLDQWLNDEALLKNSGAHE